MVAAARGECLELAEASVVHSMNCGTDSATTEKRIG
jgi:hypothetical protein